MPFPIAATYHNRAHRIRRVRAGGSSVLKPNPNPAHGLLTVTGAFDRPGE